MKKIVITGSKGLIGTELCKFFKKKYRLLELDLKLGHDLADEKFVKKFDLNFMLASDKGGDVCEKYGAWRLKNMYGKEYFGIGRSTFLIDTKGKINKIWPKVKVDGHVDEVLKAVKECP